MLRSSSRQDIPKQCLLVPLSKSPSLQPIQHWRRRIKTQLPIVLSGLSVRSGSVVPDLEWRPPLGTPRIEAILPAGEGTVAWALSAKGPCWCPHGRLEVEASSGTGHLFYRKVNPGDLNLKGHQFCGQARTGTSPAHLGPRPWAPDPL